MDPSKNQPPVIRKPNIVRVENVGIVSAPTSKRDSAFNNAQSSFFEKNKLLILVATLSIFLFVSIYLYFFYFGDSTPAPEQPKAGQGTLGSGGQDVVKDGAQIPNGAADVSPEDNVQYISNKDTLKKLWGRAVSGQSIIYSGSGTSTIVGMAWVDKLTGNVYKAYEPLWAPVRITNTTISNTVNAYFLANGNVVVLQQYNKDKNTISSIIADVPRVNEGDPGAGLDNMTNLSDNIKSMTVSTDGATLYMVVGTTAGSSIFKMNLSSRTPELITSLSTSDWEVKYLSDDKLLLYQRPAATLKSSAYTLNIKTKQLNLLYNDFGLTAIGGKGKYVYSTNNNTYTDVGGSTIARGVRTIAGDKCIISSSTSFSVCAIPKDVKSISLPDDWYDYSYYTDDSLYLYGLDYEESSALIDLSSVSGSIFDVEAISISNDNKYVGLSNRYGSLYVFNLAAGTN